MQLEELIESEEALRQNPLRKFYFAFHGSQIVASMAVFLFLEKMGARQAGQSLAVGSVIPMTSFSYLARPATSSTNFEDEIFKDHRTSKDHRHYTSLQELAEHSLAFLQHSVSHRTVAEQLLSELTTLFIEDQKFAEQNEQVDKALGDVMSNGHG